MCAARVIRSPRPPTARDRVPCRGPAAQAAAGRPPCVSALEGAHSGIGRCRLGLRLYITGRYANLGRGPNTHRCRAGRARPPPEGAPFTATARAHTSCAMMNCSKQQTATAANPVGARVEVRARARPSRHTPHRSCTSKSAPQAKNSKSMMEKPRLRAAKKSNDSDLRRQNHTEIAEGISLRRKTRLGWREGSTCTGLQAAIRSTSRIRLGYVRCA